jgi:hypothetical protein
MENAWVVDYCSSTQTAEALVKLLADPALRERLG